MINKRCSEEKARSRLPCPCGKRPPAVSAELRCGAADRDPVGASPVAARTRSCHLGPDVQESKTKQETEGQSGKDNYRD